MITDEPLTRFIFSRSHFNVPKNRVKHQAFLPPTDLKLSVFRIEGLTDGEVWQIGEGLEAERDDHLHARADLASDAVVTVGLSAIRDEPPPRHANIIGWPPDDKDSRKILAMELAAVASLATR